MYKAFLGALFCPFCAGDSDLLYPTSLLPTLTVFLHVKYHTSLRECVNCLYYRNPFTEGYFSIIA